MRRTRLLLFLILIALAALAYRLRRQIIGRLLGLTPVQYAVNVESALPVVMRDGVTLVADHYYPTATRRFPTILIRSPYGREPGAGVFGWVLAFIARRFAERGYHVVTQDTRGRFDSGGDFNPVLFEHADGVDTLKWIGAQPWFDGRVGTWGPSYLGIVQLAAADSTPPIMAMVPSLTGSMLHTVLYPDDALDLGLALRWLALFQELDRCRSRPLIRSAPMLIQVERAIAPALNHLPVTEAAQVALGHEVPYYTMWLEHPAAEDALWQDIVRGFTLPDTAIPTHFIGGWYDFFLRAMLQDYARFRAAGKRPYLTIGPWHHFSNAFIMFNTIDRGLEWFDAHMKGQKERLRAKPVSIFVMGARQWREFDDWPPPARVTLYYLRTGRALSTELPPEDSASSHYRYDPANPTPAVGGTQFSVLAGRRDNRRLEARPDVLTFTTLPLSAPLEVIGPVRLSLYVRSSTAYTDFFGRLCDVHPNGRSMNICDGLFRITPGKGEPQPDGSLRIEVDMWATAHRFAAGHRLRLQVSSGAHPRWSRNLGCADQLGTAMRCADQTIYHDAQHPSALLLPIYG